MPSLLIIEPHWEGHHLRYLRWIAREAVVRGYDVYLAASPGMLEQPLYLRMQAESGERIRTLKLPVAGLKPEERSVPDLVKLEFCYWKMLAECYRQLSEKERPDYVLVPYLDYCAYATAILGSPFGRTAWAGFVMRPTFHLEETHVRVFGSGMQQAKERLFFRLLRGKTLRAVFTFDEALVQHIREKRPGPAGRLRFLPEPAELQGSHSRESARRMLGIPSDRIVILVYGALDASKGIDALMAATKDERFPREVGILLAGRQDAEVKALLDSPWSRTLREAGRLYELDAFLFGEDEQAVFRASDIAWIGYRWQYISSGVLLQATMAGLPIIACDEGLIRRLTTNHRLGFAVHIDDARAVTDAVSKLARNRDLAAELASNAARFSVPHHADNFSRALGEELTLNFPPKP